MNLTCVFLTVITIAALFVVAVSMIAMALWYCFDDRLAAITGIPALGTLPWTLVWLATLFLSSIFKGTRVDFRSSRS